MKYQELVNEIALRDKAIKDIDEQIVLCQAEIESTSIHVSKLLKEKNKLQEELLEYQKHKKNTHLFDFSFLGMLAIDIATLVFFITCSHKETGALGSTFELVMTSLPFIVGVLGTAFLIKGTLKSRKYVKDKDHDFEEIVKRKQKRNDKEQEVTLKFLKKLETNNKDLRTKKVKAINYKSALEKSFIKAYQEVETEEMRRLDFPVEQEIPKVLVKK